MGLPKTVKRLFSFSVKIMVILLVLLTAVCCLRRRPERIEGKINVTSLVFPSYDFVRVIAGDRVNLAMLLPPGVESHSFEPSPLDIMTIRESDLFIYPGSENAGWADRILASASNGRMRILKMADLVDAVEEELVEGMEDSGHKDESRIIDEHVWNSPGNAKAIVAAITEALCDLDSANAHFYRQNSSDYAARLDELDAAFRLIVEGARRKTIIFGDRFPFRYFADAYGLEYFAAFPGCSTETEPSAAAVAFLINKVKSERIPVVFFIEFSNGRMADAISEATGAKKLLLHSSHNVTKKDFENGVNYLDIQKANLVNLKEALW